LLLILDFEFLEQLYVLIAFHEKMVDIKVIGKL